MFVQTHRKTEGSDTFTVYRDREARRTVTHFSAHRGGCLYLGEVVVKNDDNCATFAFSTTSAPWADDTGTLTAAAYWDRHNDKLN